MKIKIRRDTETPACIGTMGIDDIHFGFTLERPWLGNANKISCIPAGTYQVDFTRSPRFKRIMLEVLNVKDRDGIRLHSANVVEELEGCIAVSKERSGFNISNSLIEKLEDRCLAAIKKGEKITLEIFNAWPNASV